MLQTEKQSKWQSQQIDKHFKNQAIPKLRRKRNSKQSSNSIRHQLTRAHMNRNCWMWGTVDITGRLIERSKNLDMCEKIIKHQDHMQFSSLRTKHEISDQYDDESSPSFSWSCLQCTYENEATCTKCQICNTPNYSLNVILKPPKSTKSDAHTFTLADYIEPKQGEMLIECDQPDHDDDELMQIAIQLSYQCNTDNAPSATPKQATVRQRKTQNSKYVQNTVGTFGFETNKLQRKLFKASCAEYLKEMNIMLSIKAKPKQIFINEINDIFHQTVEHYPMFNASLYFALMYLKTMIPTKRQIYQTFANKLSHYGLSVQYILTPHLLHNFFQYGCRRDVYHNDIKLMYTESELKRYHIYTNPKSITCSVAPSMKMTNQDLLLFGYTRSIYPYLSYVPDDIIAMISDFLDTERKDEWKYNLRNAPTDHMEFVADAKMIDFYRLERENKQRLFVCLVKGVKNGASQTTVRRNAKILPMYSVTWTGNIYQPQWRQTSGSVMVFKPVFKQNGKKKTRKLQRKWSAYHKLQQLD